MAFSSDILDFTHQMINSLSVTNMVIQPSIDEDLNQSEILCVHLKNKRDGLPNQDGGSKTDLWHFMTQKISNIENMFFFSNWVFLNQAQLSYNNIDMMGYDGIFTLYATYGELDIYIYIHI